MKTLHERHDADQKQLLVTYLKRANRILLEKERLARSRTTPASIDIVINQDCIDTATEVYVPVKKGQKGRLTELVQAHCKETLQHTAQRIADEGTYHGYLVFRTTKPVEAKALAVDFAMNVPRSSQFSKYNVEIRPAYNFRFSSEAEYHTIHGPRRNPKGALLLEVAQRLVEERSTRVPAEDVKQIRAHAKQGLTYEQIHKKMPKYEPPQIRSILSHVKMGTYDRPVKEVSAGLQQKLFKEFRAGRNNDEIADKYELNRFQVIAHRAVYTRQNGKVGA